MSLVKGHKVNQLIYLFYYYYKDFNELQITFPTFEINMVDGSQTIFEKQGDGLNLVSIKNNLTILYQAGFSFWYKPKTQTPSSFIYPETKNRTSAIVNKAFYDSPSTNSSSNFSIYNQQNLSSSAKVLFDLGGSGMY